MDGTILATLIGIAGCALGYWTTTFFVQPILRYKNIRNQVLHDFIYYAQVINADNLNDEMKALYRERGLANRKASADLRAATMDLPCPYLLFLKYTGKDPAKAASRLMGFSNTKDLEKSFDLERDIRVNLGLPFEEAT